MSVALFRYCAYLVMIVENWWCPFVHDKKEQYYPGAVDRSYWHIHHLEQEKLHQDDLNNPIWNDEADLQTGDKQVQKTDSEDTAGAGLSRKEAK